MRLLPAALTIRHLMWASRMQIFCDTIRPGRAATIDIVWAKRSRAQPLWQAAAAAARSLTEIGSWYLTVTVR